MTDALWSRRRMLRTLFCSSAAMSLNLTPRRLSAAETAGDADLHWLAIGDFGSQKPEQQRVADAMKRHIQLTALSRPGLMLLGDNFYGKMEGGLHSPRWHSGFERMYPADLFPGPCPVVLGNHDYHDNAGGELAQLGYARANPGTRWHLPAKWHRLDLPAANPVATFLFIDTNLRHVSGRPDSKTGKATRACLTPDEEQAQWKWLGEQLAGSRAPFTVCVGHHPVYSNGSHGDTPALVDQLAPLLQQHRVCLYLCGHDHDLQHLEIEGQATSHVLSGGGGASIRQLKRNGRGFAKAVYGFAHLQIRHDRMLVRLIDADGLQLHAFHKHPDGRVQILPA
jgi:3',5'-cyclic AMP phosphodiesterase CpdA